MLYIGANGVDITGAVDRNSVQIVEQLNNRSNTARFSVTDLKVTEGQEIQIREYTTLREDANS